MLSLAIVTRSLGVLALGWVSVAAVACTSGSASTPDSDPEPTTDGGVTTTVPQVPEGMTSVCVAGAIPFAQGFKPAIPVDFVGSRIESTKPRTSDGGGVEAVWTAAIDPNNSVGKPCTSAADVAACEASFASFRLIGDQCGGVPIVIADSAIGAPVPLPPGQCSLAYLVYTRGTEFTRLDSVAKLLEFFGTIDSPEEALLLARDSGEVVRCATGAEAAYRAIDGGGYELYLPQIDGCGEVSGARTVRVSAEGTITLVKEEKKDEGAGFAKPSGSNCR